KTSAVVGDVSTTLTFGAATSGPYTDCPGTETQALVIVCPGVNVTLTFCVPEHSTIRATAGVAWCVNSPTKALRFRSNSRTTSPARSSGTSRSPHQDAEPLGVCANS